MDLRMFIAARLLQVSQAGRVMYSHIRRTEDGLWGFTLRFLCLRGGGWRVMPTKPQTLSPKQCVELCLSKGDVENISSFENLIEGWAFLSFG